MFYFVLISIASKKTSWFKPSEKLSTTQPLTYFPSGQSGERIGRVQLRKIMGWNKDNLTGKAKERNTCQEGKLRNYFTTFHEQAGGSITCNDTITPTVVPFFPLPQLLLLSMSPYGVGYPCRQLRPAVMAPSPVHPQSSCWWAGMRQRKDTDSVEVLPSS